MGVRSGTINPAQRYQLARDAGFSAPDAVVMAAISLLECGDCDMSAVNNTGDVSLWQINKIHWPSLGGPAVLADPAASARAAFQVWKGAGGGQSGFRQWCVYPGGCNGSSPTSWATFNGKIQQVVSSLGESAPNVGPIPIPMPGQVPIPLPAPGTATAPAPGQSISPGTQATTTAATGTSLGSIGPYKITIPSGLVLALLGVLLLLLGALIFSFNVKTNVVNAVASTAEEGA